MLSINPTITTNQKSIIGTHIKKRKEYKPNTKYNHQIKRKQSKRRKGGKKELLNNPKIINKITSTYLSVITLNVNGKKIIKPEDIEWLNGYKTRPIYMLSKIYTLQI